MDALELVAKLKLDISEYESSLGKAEKDASGFGSKVGGGLKKAGKIGAAAIGAVTVASAALGKSLMSNINQVADYGDNVDKMSQKMGISAKAYQEWDAVMQHCGTSIDAMKPAFKLMSQQAQRGAEEFQKLGISEKEVAELSQEDLFSKVIEGLQGMEEGTERTAIASKLLGRGATELGALLNTSAEETQKMKDRVNELGGVMDDKAVKAAAHFKDNLQDMKTALEGVKRNLTSEFLPAVSDIMDGFTKLIAGEQGADEALSSGMSKLNEAVEKVMPRIGELLSTLLPKVLEFGGTLITGIGEQLPDIIDAIVKQLPGLATTLIETAKKLIPRIKEVLPSIIQSLGALFKVVAKELPGLVLMLVKNFVGFIKDNMGMVIDTALEIITTLGQGLIDNLPALIDAGLELLEAIIDGIINNIDQIVDAILLIITSLVTTIMENLPKFIVKGGEIILKLIEGIGRRLPDIITTIVNTITTLITTITQHLPEILTTGMQILIELAEGLVQAIPDMLARIPEIITSLCDGLLSGDMIEKLLKAGLDMIGKIFDGLLDGDFIGTVGDIIGKLMDAVVGAAMALLGIGAKIIEKVWEGMKKAWNKVVDWAEGVLEDLFGNPMENYGDDYVAPVIDGYEETMRKNAERNQKKTAKASADHNIDIIKQQYGIHSPSKRMHDEVGVYIGQGLALGIQDGYNQMGGGAVDMSKTKFNNGMPSAQNNATAGGDIVIPVYIGQNKVEDIVVSAQKKANYRSGGR